MLQEPIGTFKTLFLFAIIGATYSQTIPNSVRRQHHSPGPAPDTNNCNPAASPPPPKALACYQARHYNHRRDVFAPTVLSPAENDAWSVGSAQTVVWDTERAPSQITNQYGSRIVLRRGERTMLNEGRHSFRLCRVRISSAVRFGSWILRCDI